MENKTQNGNDEEKKKEREQLIRNMEKLNAVTIGTIRKEIEEKAKRWLERDRFRFPETEPGFIGMLNVIKYRLFPATYLNEDDKKNLVRWIFDNDLSVQFISNKYRIYKWFIKRWIKKYRNS